MSKLLTVFGATGLQGGSVIKYILGHPELSKVFRLRGVTRDVFKASAQTLREKGVEMVQANLNDPPLLIKAVSGSDSVYAMTNCLYPFLPASAAIEIAQGKAVADACVAAGVPQIIWSTLPNTTLMSKGEVRGAEHFDSKAEVEEYIRTLDIKSTFFMAGWLMQNNLGRSKPQFVSPGKYTWWWINLDPDTRIPLMDMRDVGKFISPALLDPELYDKKRLTCATRYYTLQEIADTWTKVTGKNVRLTQSAPSAWPVALQKRLQEMRGLYSVYAYFGPTGPTDLDWTLEQVTEKPTSWEQFVQDHEPWFEA
ncbi:hypothetical protein BGW36DRAFT_294740 [Talaromyces proteolyticus]|uniref:NmrA-like domain-containing protein n=1 Tax=Talaromyces proteolyticus TaxID=1131652 RepID=A0AAD4PZH4_9EURO|nr:uncharacterized protein BGW36DRAFT_294740 [Talaromyces proteolyticus]KAH8699026.1 hypothetical protein BGW36DRAFT_294740 [Talaromyces proteolyticus]